MECSECGHVLEVRKNLTPGEVDSQDVCPECGATLNIPNGNQQKHLIQK